MGCGDSAFPVDHKRGGKGIHSAVESSHTIVTEQYTVIDLFFGQEWLHLIPAVLIHGDADYGKTLIFVLLFEGNEPRDLDLAGSAPSGPEVEQNYFALVVFEAHCLAFRIFQRKSRSSLSIRLGLWSRGAHALRFRATAGEQRGGEQNSRKRTGWGKGHEVLLNLDYIGNGREPAQPALSERPGQSHLGITAPASECPAGGVTKAFTSVVTPLSAAGYPVGIRKALLQRFRRPAEFPARASLHLRPQESLIGTPLFVPEVQPCEVENLMDEDSGQAPGCAEQLFFEDDLPAAQKGRRMNRRPLGRAGEQLSAMRSQ